jgi:carbon monoxide dehydrogenase subunit G
VELTHRFSVPVGVDEAFATFEDIASVAECFPGASVTAVSGQTFEGTAKVKLGPIAMLYAGTGSFLERDAAAHRMVVEAKGRDKRGNGTAGATIRATFTPDGDARTDVEVLTDLQITGKPAQFGRGVIQDVSDKLLGQFVDCLQERIGTTADAAAAAPAGSLDLDSAAGAAAPDALGAMREPAGPADPAVLVDPATPGAVSPPPEAGGAPAPATRPPSARSVASDDDALDLGATVLPVLARQYGPPAAAVLLLLLLVRWLVRRR